MILGGLHKSIIGKANAGSPLFRNLPARLSIPTLLEGFTSSKSFKAETGVVGRNKNLSHLNYYSRNIF